MAPSSSRVVTVAAVSASLLTISLVATAVYLRRRRRLRETRLNGDEGAASPCCSMELDAKPQYRFQRVLADNSYRPFQHYKAEGKEKGVSIKAHPYEDAIASLLESPPLFSEFVASNECPLMSSTFVWVDTLQKLECLVETLQKERAFAVDTEQHSLRSFLGFTALMQISTQTEDFLVDTIILHDVMSILCPVFADPFILKVFHGADNDILWLQRDFHIYVVNLFDTAKACEVLSKPHKSLAYLLRSYCGVITNKMLQREDWRIRPLSAEMVNYARTDAHYLLFIASCLVSELANQSHDDGMSEAYRRSNAICLQLYVKEKESFPGDSAAASIFSRHFNTQELSWKNDHIRELVRRLCTWRDLMARIHDESLRYVLSDEAIASLSIEVQHGPSSIHDCIVQADLNKDNPLLMPSPSPVVEGHIRDICCIFEKITEDPDDVFREIFQRYLYQTKTCPLSIYNYVLLNELNVKLTKTLFPEQSGRKLGAPVGRKSSRQLFVQKFSCKSPVYHNCRIFASDGRLLCYCDRRKLEWYLRRDLAKLVEDDPPAIMLLFEPKGRPEDEDNDFYIQSKKNICVGCGERNHYLRYRIIPSCYRMHFPEHLKSHRSHDIVLLCVDCHEIAHSAAEKYKRQVAEEFGIPLFVKKVMESGENEVIALASTIADNGCMNAGVSPLQLRTAAMALVRHGSTMPPKRREELREIIKEYFGGREISENDLEKALLVGMSPAERRRLERKRGLPFGSSEKHAVHSINESVVEKSLESFVSLSNNLHTASESMFADDANINPTEDVGTGNRNLFGYVSNPAESTGQDLEREVIASENVYIVERTYSRGLASGGENGSSHENNKSVLNVSANYYSSTSIKKRSCSCILETANCICSDAANNFESRDLSKANDCSNVSYRSTSRKYSKKVSLLGHGPHGSQVVRRILEKNGEDGILQFCQRWRHVFVESIHPRFLPAGWDIRHSGKREFGKYSVYNPSKTSEADDQQDCSFLAD